MNQFSEEISNSVYGECDSLKNTFEKLNQIANEFKDFQAKEQDVRARVCVFSLYNQLVNTGPLL
jgi:hypothetical protein